MAQIYVETKDQPRKINLEVFVHKADGMSDDYKLGECHYLACWAQVHVSSLGLQNTFNIYKSASWKDAWTMIPRFKA